MKEVDPGHEYLLDSYDGGEPVRLTFVKREGEGYPFNVGHHPGTNCQEVIRALIDRVKYLQRQIRCDENIFVIDYLRRALWQFEVRAAQRHGRKLPDFYLNEIEDQPTCAGCGHIGCAGEGHRASETKTAATPPPSDAARKAAARDAARTLQAEGLLWSNEAAVELGGEPFSEEAQIDQVAAIISSFFPSAQNAVCASCRRAGVAEIA